MKRTVLIIAATLALVSDIGALDFNLFDNTADSDQKTLARSGFSRRYRRPVRIEREENDTSAAASAESSGGTLADIAGTVEKIYVTNVVERVVTNVVERVVTNVVDRVVDRVVPVDRVVTNTVDRVVPVDRVVTNTVDRFVPVERVVTNVVDRVVTKDRYVTNVVDRVVTKDRFITNVVEKIVVDREQEERLERSNEDLARRNAALARANEELEKAGGRRELENASLVESNDELKRRLADSEDRNARLSRVVAPSALKQLTNRPAKISSMTTYYDRKEGFAVFTGRVHVDDEQYQMHAEKAYVFFSGTNELKRLVAIGGVALTNGARRAYGGKASYHKDSGMVVLYSDESGAPAEVRDESKVQDQTVKGERIKFWINTEQVEVLDARISAPVGGGIGDLNELRSK